MKPLTVKQPLLLLLCILSALLCITLVACNGQGDPGDTSTDTDPETADETAAETMSETVAETDTNSAEADSTGEPDSETEPMAESGDYDLTPLTLLPKEDRFPAYAEYETAVIVADQPTEEPSAIAVAYDVPLSEEENGDLLEAAAKVGVLDCGYPISLRLIHRFAESGDVAYRITDLDGEAVYSGTLSGSAGETVSVTRGIKGHPIGYFKLMMGEESLSYVVTPPLKNRTLTDSPFASDLAAYYLISDPDAVYPIASAARMMGITWIRDRAKWPVYEKISGVYDFTDTEQVYRDIDRAGLNMLVMLQSSPMWIRDRMNMLDRDSRPGGLFGTQLDVYKLTKAMTEYYKGIVDAWELNNEPEQELIDPAEIFAAWYKAAALGVYDADPHMIISHGGLCHPNSQDNFMHLTLRNDIMKYSSIFNYHQHVIQGDGIPNYGDLYIVKGTVPTLALYGACDKPVWITESGMALPASNEKALRDQAPYIVTSTVQSLALGTDKHFWFILSPYQESGHDFGSFSPSLEPYPTVAAEAVMTDVLGEARYLGELADLPKNAYGYLFKSGKRAVGVVWSSDDKQYILETEKPVIVTDMMGNETLMTPEGGRISVKIGVDPVYITYSEPPQDYFKQVFTETEPQPIHITEGDRVIITPEFDGYHTRDRYDGHLIADGTEIRVRVTNFNENAVTGSVTLTVPGFNVEGCDTEITVEPLSEGFITLTLRKTADTTADTAVNDFVVFVGRFNGKETSEAAIHVRTEGTVSKPSLTLRTLRSGQSYTASDLQAVVAVVKHARGEVEIRLNEAKYEKFAYEKDRITIDLSDIEAGKHTLTVALRTEGGDYTYAQISFLYNGETVTVL